MIAIDKPNPFSVLRLPTSATSDEVAKRGQELGDIADGDDERQLVRWAVEALNRQPATRAIYELLELPDADYDDPAWMRFTRRHRRNPARLAREPATAAVEAFDVVALLDAVLEDLRRIPEPSVGPALTPPGRPVLGPPPLEVCDVLFG